MTFLHKTLPVSPLPWWYAPRTQLADMQLDAPVSSNACQMAHNACRHSSQMHQEAEMHARCMPQCNARWHIMRMPSQQPTRCMLLHAAMQCQMAHNADAVTAAARTR
eukprot:1155292-Pelagomonas_calceolata.AAC.3